MLQISTSELNAPREHTLAIGSVIDGQYRLIREIEPVSGRPCFLAENLGHTRQGHRVELVLTNTGTTGPGTTRLGGRKLRYIVRRRAVDQVEPAAAPRLADNHSDARAMSAFQSRVMLSGVCIRKGNTLVYNGWDRESQRAVRVVVEPAE